VRVLLVEASDEEATRLDELLSKAIFTTHHLARVRTLSQALSVLAELEVDVILLDLTLPDSCGLETLQRIHDSVAATHTPIVVITEGAGESLALEALRFGAQDYLIRGEFQARVLIRTIQHAMEHQKVLSRLGETLQRELYLGSHDSLTGLPNRYLFHDRLSQALLTARRDQRWLGLLFIDLDRFRPLNETLGHSIGDQLLQAVAKRLLGCLPTTDSVARIGGDQYIVLLHEVTQALDAAKVAQNIEQRFAHPFHLAGKQLNVTVSIGISIYPDDGTDADMLINSAETAMRCGKDSSGNTHRFCTLRMNASSRRQLTLENHLREAIENEQLLLHFQPIVDGRTGHVTAAEALARWNHPELGMIAPDEFIPIAEARGIITSIGDWVLRSVCRQIDHWQRDGHPAIPVAVNVSPLQLWNSDFLGFVMQTLLDASVDGTQLQLEITESCLMRNMELVVDTLNALKQLGVRVAIDDFGTGFSSLSVLRQLPVDLLKIPRTFLSDTAEDPRNSAVISAIVGLAKNLGLRAVGEGVETESQRRLLLERECTTMQGFLFSDPLPADQFTRLLASNQALLPAESLCA
jgi:diguanylate cyclase (GGDEF)-like protein